MTYAIYKAIITACLVIYNTSRKNTLIGENVLTLILHAAQTLQWLPVGCVTVSLNCALACFLVGCPMLLLLFFCMLYNLLSLAIHSVFSVTETGVQYYLSSGGDM